MVSMAGMIIIMPQKLKYSHDYFWLENKLFWENGLLKEICECLKLV
jgi:hypothetical protein